LALARWSLAGDEVAAGRLVVATDKPLSFFRTYWLVHSKHGRAHPAFAEFRDWLTAEMARFPRPPGLGAGVTVSVQPKPGSSVEPKP
ncbi:MAG TPA: hypothetical protein VKA43_08210, partial [Gammaproteobacteria bacterium]|nr:hypothetical protein [Gammaproteobacteria bacterium]